jgi:hypothetical protein
MTEEERLRDALADALSGLHEMIGYASEYFREKWDLDGYIDRATEALMATPGGYQALFEAGFDLGAKRRLDTEVTGKEDKL